MQVRPASLMIRFSSDPLYLVSPPNPESEYPAGEHISIAWNPAAASVFSVSGKSLEIMSRTGHVWHRIGRPSGLAWSSVTPPHIKPAIAACAAALLQNSRLEIADMRY